MFQKNVRLLLASVCFILLGGCASAPEKVEFQIAEQALHTKQSESGDLLFVYIVTVEPTPLMKVSSHKPMSRGELKRYAEHQRVEDSPELKLQLEERAVELLEKALGQRDYCRAGHKINRVYWRQRSVQLRGNCL
ncbi:hypothetical protein [Pseudoalteromonas byunsanensis]|uniref:Lipoprotein n=1 Tax=Pseudoalteromonas byunsanensis TaxID=327939 RepID=A0A1S1NDG5_9GAMM|nr:hypothetical protein [Pseudoalteromonas byunsanensis]OHU97723.1 hypothetical protein BIW53_01145 [Pseudoalteromonas byunsanensis]